MHVKVIRDTGYSRVLPGIDSDTCEIRLHLNEQSGDIRQGVDIGGAGDQGLVFGYATDETPEMMPPPITLAHRLVQRQADLRRFRAIPWLRPDAKSQVTVRYEDDKPVDIDRVVLSTQHADAVPIDTVHEVVEEQIIRIIIQWPSCARLINHCNKKVTIPRTGIEPTTPNKKALTVFLP